eukprot:scaffold442_cov268-Pinguiococcus_pyrenoidosus.AAC.23
MRGTLGGRPPSFIDAFRKGEPRDSCVWRAENSVLWETCEARVPSSSDTFEFVSVTELDLSCVPLVFSLCRLEALYVQESSFKEASDTEPTPVAWTSLSCSCSALVIEPSPTTWPLSCSMYNRNVRSWMLTASVWKAMKRASRIFSGRRQATGPKGRWPTTVQGAAGAQAGSRTTCRHPRGHRLVERTG